MTKVGWGVIGAGGIADRRTIPEGILPARNARLVAVMSSNLENAKKLGAKYGVPAYSRVGSLLANRDVEAVYIATPNHLHKSQVLACARAGKHVLCEKPLGMTSKQAEAMVAACREAGVKLGVGFMMRFNAIHQQIRKVIEDGGLGTIVFARAQLTCWYPQMEGAWRQDPSLGGGGAIMDLASHCVDLLEMLLGPVAEVSAFIETRVQNYASDDTNALLLKFRSGVLGFVDCAFNIPDEASENVLEIQGSHGSIKARMSIGQGPGGDLRICTPGDSGDYAAAQNRNASGYKSLEIETRNTYLSEIEAFSDAILNKTSFPADGESGLHSMRVLEAAIRASKTGKVQMVRNPVQSI